MKLSEWRKAKDLKPVDVAALIGCTTVALGRYERGRVPEPGKLQKIIEVTGGAVTANDFFEVPGQEDSEAAHRARA